MRKVAITAAEFLLLSVLLEINIGCGGSTGRSSLAPGTPSSPVPTSPSTSSPAQPPMAAFIETAGYGQSEIYTVTNDGTGFTKVSARPGEFRSVYVLPDGSKGVFAAPLAPGEYSQIFYLAPFNSTATPIQLTTTSEDKTSPMLSADGNQITFALKRPVQPDPEFVISDIAVMNVDGSDLHVVEAPAGWTFSHPFLSPDGNKITGQMDTGWFGDSAIFVMNADGTDLARLTPAGANSILALTPAFSPNGKQIVFGSLGWGDFGLYVINVDGTGLQRVGERDAGWADPLFVNDRIMFLFDNEIYSMKTDGTDVKRITNNTSKDWF